MADTMMCFERGFCQ